MSYERLLPSSLSLCFFNALKFYRPCCFSKFLQYFCGYDSKTSNPDTKHSDDIYCKVSKESYNLEQNENTETQVTEKSTTNVVFDRQLPARRSSFNRALAVRGTKQKLLAVAIRRAYERKLAYMDETKMFTEQNKSLVTSIENEEDDPSDNIEVTSVQETSQLKKENSISDTDLVHTLSDIMEEDSNFSEYDDANDYLEEYEVQSTFKSDEVLTDSDESEFFESAEKVSQFPPAPISPERTSVQDHK